MRRLIDFLPENNRAGRRNGRPRTISAAKTYRSTRWCPDNPNKPYDMKELILKVVDEGDFFEIQAASPRTS